MRLSSVIPIVADTLPIGHPPFVRTVRGFRLCAKWDDDWILVLESTSASGDVAPERPAFNDVLQRSWSANCPKCTYTHYDLTR
jgi:hypothetical protein